MNAELKGPVTINVSKLLFRYRTIHRLTQAQMARRMFVSEKSYQKWESGKRNVPEAYYAELNKQFGIPLDLLFGQDLYLPVMEREPRKDVSLEVTKQAEETAELFGYSGYFCYESQKVSSGVIFK